MIGAAAVEMSFDVKNEELEKVQAGLETDNNL